jgi:hypothetical protein
MERVTNLARIAAPLRGMYRDILAGHDGRVVYDSGWHSNTIVDNCRTLLAGFMRNQTAGGISFLAVGQGDPAWDTSGAPAPDPGTTTDLVNRFAGTIAAADLVLEYLDATDAVTGTPTNRIQVTATLPPGFPTPLPGQSTYPLREFGLFGTLDGGDIMINCIRHPVIQKDATTSLIRVVRLYF